MSAAPKWTPGPWAACSYGDYGDYEGRCCIVIGDDGTTRIAAVMGNEEEAEADARLIAAAPDLVFQLLAASNYIDALGGDSKSYRAAIAEAKGEA